MKERAIEKAIKKAQLTAHTRWTKAALIGKIDQQASKLDELQHERVLLDEQIRMAERAVAGYQHRDTRMTKRNAELRQDIRNLKAIRFSLVESFMLSIRPPTELSDRLVDTGKESPS